MPGGRTRMLWTVGIVVGSIVLGWVVVMAGFVMASNCTTSQAPLDALAKTGEERVAQVPVAMATASTP